MCGFGLAIRPPGNAVRGREFRDKSVVFQRIAQLRAILRVPFHPGGEIIAGRETVTLLVAAPAVSQHEVVRQIDGIAGPCDKVVPRGPCP
jgi:hypothetical protein